VNITLDIKCPELAQAINNLASAMSIRAVGDELQDIVKPAAPKEDLHDPRHVGAALTGKPKAAKAAPEPVVEPATVPEQEPAAEPEAPAVDYNQVKTAVMAVSKAKGRDAAVALLGEFDAKVGGDLTEEQWGPFIDRAAEVLG
jgi:hypothetical protein